MSEQAMTRDATGMVISVKLECGRQFIYEVAEGTTQQLFSM